MRSRDEHEIKNLGTWKTLKEKKENMTEFKIKRWFNMKEDTNFFCFRFGWGPHLEVYRGVILVLLSEIILFRIGTIGDAWNQSWIIPWLASAKNTLLLCCHSGPRFCLIVEMKKDKSDYNFPIKVSNQGL